MANGKAQAVEVPAAETVDQSFEAFKRQITDTMTLIGGLIFFPAVLAFGLAHGLRAGILEGLKKTLKIYRDFNARG